MKCVQPSTHPGYTDFCRGEGVVVRLREQVLEVQFLYFRVGCFLQNGPVTVLSQYSSYSTKRSSYCIVTVQFLSKKRFSYCIVTVQFLYHKTVQSLYCHSAVSIYKTVQVLYCHSAVPIIQNGPVTVLSQCSFYLQDGSGTV